MSTASRALRSPAAAPAAILLVVLTVASFGYGYERDELYFRMLRPAFAYVDQPGLTPWLARTLAAVVDEAFMLRIPATLASVVSLWLVVAMSRELGASARAQRVAGFAFAGTFAALGFGHVLLTSTLDLTAWQLVILLALRAVLREEGGWWLWAGLVAGLATYNRVLVALLLLGIVVGLLVTRQRRWLLRWEPWAGAVIAAVVALPNLVYQARNDWPQLQMGEALADNNADDVRVFMWVFLLIGLSPLLLPMAVRGGRALWRRPETRFLVVALAVSVAATFVSGAQPHYPIGLLPVLLAAGARETGLSSRGWFLALNAAVVAVIALPVVPASVLGRTPLPDVNLLVADQIDWPTYAEQVAGVWDSLDPADRDRAVMVTSNYGQAGALARFGGELGLPRPFSGQNALVDEGPPPADTDVVVFVGGQLPWIEHLFGACTVRDRLDNGLGVDNEEQGQPIAVCTEPLDDWPGLWERMRHLD